jgi:DNA-binding CsgD family transcriptional regulator
MTNLLVAAGWFYAWWTGCMTVVYGTDDSNLAMVAYRLSYLAILPVNVVNTVLFMEIAGMTVIVQRIVGLVGVVAVVVIGAGYLETGFPWSGVIVGPSGNQGIEGPSSLWSQLSDVFFIGLDGGSIALLVIAWIRERSRKRRYLIGFTFWAIVILVPLYVGLMFLADITRGPLLVFVPGGVLLAMILFVIRRWRLFVDPLLTFSKILPPALAVPVLLVDMGDTVIGANESARKLLSSDGVPLTGRPLNQVLDGPTLDRCRRSPHFDQFGDPVGAVVVLPQSEDQEPWPTDLSARETEVLQLVVQGLSNLEIGDRLFVSEGTIKSHVHRILRRTESADREHLVRRWGRTVS